MYLKSIVVGLIAFQSVAIAQVGNTRGNGRLSRELHSAARGADEQLDVIVRYKEQPESFARRSLGKFAEVGMTARRVTAAELAELEQDPNVEYVTPDREVGATHFPPWMYMEAIGFRFAAMTVPERPVQTGSGIYVAVLDSGVNKDAYLNLAPACTTSRVVYSKNFVTTENTTADLYGHGTHVAGIIGGDGTCLGGAGASPMTAVAPKVKLLNLRVLDASGRGQDSYVIAAINHAISLKNMGTYPIKVINLSLGRPVRESFRLDPLCQAVEKAWKAGITVVVAAGNAGRDNT
jgi:serine protease AprX